MTRDAVRLVLRRASSQREVLAVVAAVLLVTVILVTACGVVLRVASQSGVRAGLDRAAAADRVVVVSGNPDDAAGLAAADTAVRRALASAVSPAPAGVQRRTVSSSYALRGGAERDRLVLGVYEGARRHVRLVDGSWPAGPDQVVVPAAAASALGLAPGRTVELLGQDGKPLRLTVSGAWTPRDPDDAFWAEDPLGPVGVTDDGGFRTFGPLLLPDGTADGGVGRLVDPRVSWLSTPGLARLSAAALDRVEARVDALEQDGADDLSADLPDPRVVTRLDDVLRALRPSLAAARTSVTVPTLLLLALALASLVLVGRVVADARAGDVRLRESRGHSRSQVLRAAGAEMLVLGLVVGALGPWLAPPLVRGVVAATGESRAAPSLDRVDWLWAGATVLVAVLVLVRAAGGTGGSEASAPRSGWRRLLPSPRLVVEVLVLVLAAVAWQQSGTGDAPPLVSAAAPALVVLAVLLVAARLLPAATRVAGGWVGRTRGLLPAVVGWELTRRVEQQRGSLVTTGLAAAVTVFLAGLVTSWAVSQDDQAAVATAAPVRVTGLSTAEADGLASRVGGVVVERRSAGLPSGTGTVLVVPRAEASDVLDSPVAGGWPQQLERLRGGPGDVPALVTRSVADQAGDGDALSLQLADTNVRVRVVGVLPAPPTAAPSDPVLLVDRDALARRLGGGTPPRGLSSDDTEVWTDASPAAVRSAAPASSVVLDRAEVADGFRSGPVGTGLLAGSVLALVAAVMLGVLASLSDTATTLRARRRELASLRAQGLSRRRLVQAVALERAALLVVATVLGSATGWLAVRLFLGRLVLTDSGLPASPAAEATAPWVLLIGGTAVVLALLVALVALAAARVAHRPLGTDLREAT